MSDQDKQKTIGCSEKCDAVDESAVHSANSWEKVDLGDDERKKKFLRLMGAAKTEHHGRFVIGDKEPVHVHSRDKADTDDLNKKLEDQFNYSNEHKITRWSHTGLGFDDKDKSQPPQPTTEAAADKPKESGNVDKCEQSNDKPSAPTNTADTKKRESTEDTRDTQTVPKKPKMMMNFVKASD